MRMTKNTPPFLSIITINYNDIEGLKKTYASLKSQTSMSYKWIVVDGDSDDGSVEFLHEIESDISQLIVEKDAGIYDAFNKGKSIVDTEYFCYLNSGDVYYENSVETILNGLRKSAGAQVVCFANYHKSDKKILRKTYVSHRLVRFFKIMPPHQGTVLHTESFRQHSYDTDYRIAGDFEFFLRNFGLFKNAHIYKEVIVDQFVGGVSNSGIKSRIKGNKECLRAFLKNGYYFGPFYMAINLIYKVKIQYLNA